MGNCSIQQAANNFYLHIRWSTNLTGALKVARFDPYALFRVTNHGETQQKPWEKFEDLYQFMRAHANARQEDIAARFGNDSVQNAFQVQQLQWQEDQQSR